MAGKATLLQIRRLDPSELGWANKRYTEIDFLPSASTDMIAVALAGGIPAGLGRVAWLTATAGELGGIYVFPALRGSGIAKRLVSYLIAECGMETLYCLPFEHLHDLYAAAGFMPQPVDGTIPAAVRSKYAWCNSHYPERVQLMARRSNLGHQGP